MLSAQLIPANGLSVPELNQLMRTVVLIKRTDSLGRKLPRTHSEDKQALSLRGVETLVQAEG